MKKASGILVTKDNDYEYINRFIDFLERIVDIMLKLFDKLGGLTKKATDTDAEAAG